MVANSVVPTVGPAGVLIGAGLGTALRLVLGRVMPDYSANAVLFVVAAVGYVLSASLALRIPRNQLGPDEPEPTRAGDVVAGLVAALAHLRERRPAGLGLLAIGGHRVIYGIVTVATILVYRNYFHTAGPGGAGDRRPRAAGGGHRGGLRLRGRGHAAGDGPDRHPALDDRLPGRPRRSSRSFPGRSTPRCRWGSRPSCSA